MHLIIQPGQKFFAHSALVIAVVGVIFVPALAMFPHPVSAAGTVDPIAAGLITGLYRTGVDNNGNKLPQDVDDTHWSISRVISHNPTTGSTSDACEYTYSGSSVGAMGVHKIPQVPSDSSTATPVVMNPDAAAAAMGPQTSIPVIPARTVVEHYGYYAAQGVYGPAYIVGDGGSPNGIYFSGLPPRTDYYPWAPAVLPNAHYIAQNLYGQQTTSSTCLNSSAPIHGLDQDIKRWTDFVFHLNGGFNINTSTGLDLSSVSLQFSMFVDNMVKVVINGVPVHLNLVSNRGCAIDNNRYADDGTLDPNGYYAAPGYAGCVPTVQTAAITNLRSGNNSLEIYVKSGYSHMGLMVSDITASGTFRNRPYFTVTGGDISSNGNITSWNVNNAGGAGYTGAGSQLAALASGNITGFVTGTGMSGDPSGLAFANTAASSTSYGGGYTTGSGFPGTVPAKTHDIPQIVNLSWPSVVSNVYYPNPIGDVTLNGELAADQNVTIVVPAGHNLYIASNITYAPYTKVSQIPRLTVIVEDGNIYVNNNVTEIHGVFYVNHKSAADPTKGNFYSCAINAVTPIDSSNAKDHYSDCNHPLTVYGAVTANKLVLNRTYGSIDGSMGNPIAPAENFYYSPEVWLAPAAAGTGSSPAIYNSYVSLPPIL